MVDLHAEPLLARQRMDEDARRAARRRQRRARRPHVLRVAMARQLARAASRLDPRGRSAEELRRAA
ncbi:MAG: hypothetical protein WD638_05655 [Nitriliruptoraceae bacterium]